MARKRPGRGATRQRPQQMAESAERELNAKITKAAQARGRYDEPVDQGPRVKWADPDEVAEIRAAVSKIAIDTVRTVPGHVRGYGQFGRGLMPHVQPTLETWAQAGRLEHPVLRHEPQRSVAAAEIVMVTDTVDDRRKYVQDESYKRAVRSVGMFARSALYSAITTRKISDEFGPDVRSDHLERLDSNRADVAGLYGYEADLRGNTVAVAAFKEVTDRVLANRTINLGKKEAERVKGIFGKVQDRWVGLTASTTAATIRDGHPEGDYRRSIGLIDWQLVEAEKAQRQGNIPDGTMGIVSGTLRDACAEVGLDYAAVNDIEQRSAMSHQPFEFPVRQTWQTHASSHDLYSW